MIQRALAVAFAAASLSTIAACQNDVDDRGDDFEAPEDFHDNVDVQGLVDCSERTDTGYKQGSPFTITVVTVDGRPAEVSTANAYIAMQNAASNAGVTLRVVSGFRTMAEQQHLYYCYTSGSCNNGNLAARPGYSNHQSGHALDLNTSDAGVSSWLSHHASQFGFARTVASEQWHYEWWGSPSDYPGPCGNDASSGGNNGGTTGGNNGGTSGGTNGGATGGCSALPSTGGTIDDGDACFEAGGPSQYLRAVDSEGEGGSLIWTGATDNTNAVNYANWNISLAQGGKYSVDVYLQGDLATAQSAQYLVTHGAVTDTVTIDQTGDDRWQTLGTFDFNAGGAQRVHLGDNTGEASSLHRKVVFDALRLTLVDATQPPPPQSDCPYAQVNVSGSVLNVRRSPNTSQSPVGTLDNGSVVTVLGTVAGQSVSGDTDWHHIQTSNLTGYVSGAFTTCQATP